MWLKRAVLTNNFLDRLSKIFVQGIIKKECGEKNALLFVGGRAARTPILFDSGRAARTPIDYKFLTISVELVPPKPKELERKVSKCVETRAPGMLSLAESSSGFSKLRLAATKSFFIINIE